MPSFTTLEDFVGQWKQLPLNFGIIFLKLSEPGVLFVGIYLTTYSSILNCLRTLLFYAYLVLVKLFSPRNVFWCKISTVILLSFVNLCYLFFFILNIFICVFVIFLYQYCLRFINFTRSFVKPNFSFIDHFHFIIFFLFYQFFLLGILFLPAFFWCILYTFPNSNQKLSSVTFSLSFFLFFFFLT